LFDLRRRRRFSNPFSSLWTHTPSSSSSFSTDVLLSFSQLMFVVALPMTKQHSFENNERGERGLPTTKRSKRKVPLVHQSKVGLAMRATKKEGERGCAPDLGRVGSSYSNNARDDRRNSRREGERKREERFSDCLRQAQRRME
jgi:hypothetical protein